MDTLLPGMDEFLINKAHERCKELDINVITKLFASKILEDKIFVITSYSIHYTKLYDILAPCAVGA